MLVLSVKQNDKIYIFDENVQAHDPIMSLESPGILRLVEFQHFIKLQESTNHQYFMCDSNHTCYATGDQWLKYPFLRITYLQRKGRQYKLGFSAESNIKIFREVKFKELYPVVYAKVTGNV